MTELLFLSNPYATELETQIIGITEEGGLIPSVSIFYATGGGQPGDSGRMIWPSGEVGVATTVKTHGGHVALVPDAPGPIPQVGQTVTLKLDWARRFRHMRIHTALHLLSVVIPLPVSGGAITAEKGRLDFDMPDAPKDKEALTDQLNALIRADLPVTESWITADELAQNPGLVKTMSVQPPTGQGRVRLIRIGDGPEQIDLQPCGGTHVARTAEIGPVTIGKIEKKGRQNRRVNLLLDD